MTPGPEPITDRIHWHLDEAERLDKAAAADEPKPAPVASIHDMTEEWIAATLGPALLRQAADYHRTRAVQLARTVNEQKARR